MTLVNGRFEEQTADEILTALMADAKEYFGNDLHDDQLAIIRLFYRPIANRLAEAQADIGLVLDASQIDHAEGMALDLLTALIGIRRDPATTATGEVTLMRDAAAPTDYPIPSGTTVQTDALEPIRFETTDSATLTEGSTSVTVAVEAVEAGVDGNVGANTITVVPGNLTGVDGVTNAAATVGGSAREEDDELRTRAKDELGDGSRASAPALINAVKKQRGVTSVTIFVNDTSADNTGSGGLPDHSFEIVAAGGNDTDIAQAILDTKAAGDTSYAGVNGTAATASAGLPNGQTMTIDFSRPAKVQIYVDMSLVTTAEYEGDNAARDAIVDYIGGLRSSGNEVTGLGVGENIIYYELVDRLMGLDGVTDIDSLTVGTSASPTGTSNINVAESDVAVSDATDGSLTVSTQ